MKVFEYAIVFVGKKDKDGNWTEKPELLVGPKAVLCGDEREATLRAAKEIPEAYNEKLDRVQVAVRPF